MSEFQPKPADKAWITMRKEMVQTPQLHQFAKDYQYWISTDEGKRNMNEHEGKVQFIREKLSKKNIDSLTEQELLACYSKLYATSNITAKEPFFKKNVIDANGNFDYVKNQIKELLHGTDEVETRYERAITNIKQFGDSTVSELINNIYPEKCCMWNDMVSRAIPILGLEKLIPKKFLQGKSIKTAGDYKKINELLTYVKEELSSYGFTNFYLLDSLFWYTGTRQYWAIQPGTENGKDWEQFRNSNIIALGWEKIGDLTKIQDLGAELKKVGYKISGVKHQLEKFHKQIQIGDFVVANAGKSRRLGLGKIKSNYRYDKTYPDFPHVRDVEWFNTDSVTFPKQNWDNGTVHKIDRDTYKEISIKAEVQETKDTAIEPILENYKRILQYKKQIVLYGPPGTGKTFLARKLASIFYVNEYLKNKDPSEIFEILQNAGFVDIVQFHPSYSYEDFVEGIRPITDEKSMINYKIQDGIFKKLCLAAESINDNYDHYYALIDDYISVSKPIKAEKLSLPRSHGGGMNELTKKDFEKIIDYVSKTNDDIPESLTNLDNFSSFFRLNTKEKSNYGDIDGVRYHFGEGSNAPKKFVEAIQKGNVAVAYHDRKRDGFIGIGIINKDNFIINPTFVLIIDEINRGNLSKIFGELIYGLEYRNTAIKTQYSEFENTSSFLKIPNNLLVIGTMNTADRSISLFDTALRRRFAFVELLPDYNLLSELFGLGSEFDYKHILEKFNTEQNNIKTLSLLALYKINEGIMNNMQLGREKQIGHSYLIPLVNDTSQFYNIWKYEIIPLLEEFYYAESEKLEIAFGKTIFDRNEGIKDFDEAELKISLQNLIKIKNEQTN